MPTLESATLHLHDARLRELENWKETSERRTAALEERYSAIEARLLRNEKQSSDILMLQHEQRRAQKAVHVDLEHLGVELAGIRKMLLKLVGDETEPGHG